VHLHTFFPEGEEPVPWTFDSRIVFERKIQYVERLKIIEVRGCSVLILQLRAAKYLSRLCNSLFRCLALLYVEYTHS
jgi:hypothetical protein